MGLEPVSGGAAHRPRLYHSGTGDYAAVHLLQKHQRPVRRVGLSGGQIPDGEQLPTGVGIPGLSRPVCQFPAVFPGLLPASADELHLGGLRHLPVPLPGPELDSGHGDFHPSDPAADGAAVPVFPVSVFQPPVHFLPGYVPARGQSHRHPLAPAHPVRHGGGL